MGAAIDPATSRWITAPGNMNAACARGRRRSARNGVVARPTRRSCLFHPTAIPSLRGRRTLHGLARAGSPVLFELQLPPQFSAICRACGDVDIGAGARPRCKRCSRTGWGGQRLRHGRPRGERSVIRVSAQHRAVGGRWRRGCWWGRGADMPTQQPLRRRYGKRSWRGRSLPSSAPCGVRAVTLTCTHRFVGDSSVDGGRGWLRRVGIR